jgi:hypothetical protein
LLIHSGGKDAHPIVTQEPIRKFNNGLFLSDGIGYPQSRSALKLGGVFARVAPYLREMNLRVCPRIGLIPAHVPPGVRFVTNIPNISHSQRMPNRCTILIPVKNIWVELARLDAGSNGSKRRSTRRNESARPRGIKAERFRDAMSTRDGADKPNFARLAEIIKFRVVNV